jgi:hypothetical protein
MPMPASAPVKNHTENFKPTPGSRAEQILAKREADLADRKAKRIAWQACLVPLLVVVVVLAAFSMMPRPNIVVGLINLAIILYASLCTVRTWIHIIQKRRGLWILAVLGTLINGPLLAVVGLMVARLIKGY